jgi:hypothetical protein
MKEYLGQNAVYSASEMKFARKALGHPSYEVEKLSEAEFFDQFGLPLKQIGITTNAVTMIKVLDSSGKNPFIPGNVLFYRSKNVIVATWDGLFFELVRIGQACSE